MLQAEYPGPQDVDGEFAPRPTITGHLASPDTVVIGSVLGNFRNFLDNGGLYDDGFSGYLDANVQTAEMSYWQIVALQDNNGDGRPDLDLPGEYLYLILERINVDGRSALETLGRSSFPDTDNDNIPEVVDAFGDSMQLRIVQVAVTDVMPPANDVWTDVPSSEINWQRLVPIGTTGVKIPQGYEALNPVVPRPITKIRFQVVSPTLEAIE